MTADERMIERLSQYLDRDLDPTEALDFERLLETDPALQAELVALKDLRRSLGRLADREHPPAVLDALVEPLMQGRSATVVVRPWAKWLATAAAVVLGVTIVFEVNRRNIGSGPLMRPRTIQKNRQEEPAAPIQVSPDSPETKTEGERPRGAIDRLLASPDTEVDLLPDDPPPLEVIGPLQTMSKTTRESQSRSVADVDAASPASVDIDSRKAKGEGGGGETGEAKGTQQPQQRRLNEDRPEGMEIERSTKRAKLFVFMEEKTAWRDFEPGSRCESGRYSLRIRIEKGKVREVWPVGRPPAALSQHLRAGEIILGLEVEGVPDGEFTAEVMIEPRSQQQR